MDKFLRLTTIVLTLLIFKTWFFPGLISYGDFWPYFQSMYGLRSVIPFAWDANSLGGMGGSAIPFLWIHMNFGFGIGILGNVFNLPWSIIERIYYLYPLLLLLLVGPYILFSALFPLRRFAILASLIFGLNTYILMIISGGQLHGVGMAYAIVPFIFWYTTKCKPSLFSSLILAFGYGLLLLFDLRFFYLILIAVPLFILFTKTQQIRSLLYCVFVPVVMSALIHAFWILPLLVFRSNPIEDMGTAI